MPPSVMLLVCALAVTTANFSLASETIDLRRAKPVPPEQPVPVADFFRPPRLHGPKLNGNGTLLAALFETGEDKTGLMVCELEKRSTRFLRGPGNKDLYAIDWLGHDRILMSVSSDKLYAEGLFVADARHLDANYPVESHSTTSLIAVPPKTPLRPLIWIEHNAYDDGNDAGVVQIDATKNLNRNNDVLFGSFQDRNRDTGEEFNARASILRAFSQPPAGVTVDYLANPEGQLAFAVTASEGVFSLFRYVDGTPVKCPVDLDVVYPMGHGEQPQELIVIGPRQEGKPRVLQRLNAATGELGEVVCADKGYDIDGVTVYRRRLTGEILGFKYSRSLAVSVWIDEKHGTIQKLLETALPKRIVSILASDDDERWFLIATYSDRQPIAYHLFDVTTNAFQTIENSAPWLDAARMRPMGVVKFKTREGVGLEAYLTLPDGASKAHPVPLVVLPHGGPWVRDTWGFDPEAQFLASRGYAVLQPNYRGSTGYDWLFPASDQWAFRKMHDDVTDAVKTVLRTGMIDPRRMAIMGTSFGGYLAACGVAFEPDMYRCAIAIAGVFDWERVMAQSRYDRFVSAKFGILRRNLGDYRKQMESFAAISPLRHVDQIKVPMLVAHGSKDEIASIEQSRALVAQLERCNVPHEAMLVRGEGHGMSKLENEVRLYSRIESFLAEHLGGEPAAAAGAITPPQP